MNYKKLILVIVLGAVLGAMLSLFSSFSLSSTNNEGSPLETNNNVTNLNETYKARNNFLLKDSWSSTEGWKGRGLDLYQVIVVNDNVRLRDGKEQGHFSVKFSNVEKIDEIVIDLAIPNSANNTVDLVLATSDRLNKIRKTSQPGKWVKSVKSLKDGENAVNLGNMNWKKYTYLKFFMKRHSAEAPSPVIEDVKIK